MGACIIAAVGMQHCLREYRLHHAGALMRLCLRHMVGPGQVPCLQQQGFSSPARCNRRKAAIAHFINSRGNCKIMIIGSPMGTVTNLQAALCIHSAEVCKQDLHNCQAAAQVACQGQKKDVQVYTYYGTNGFDLRLQTLQLGHQAMSNLISGQRAGQVEVSVRCKRLLLPQQACERQAAQ